MKNGDYRCDVAILNARAPIIFEMCINAVIFNQ